MIKVLIFVALLQLCVAPPVTQKRVDDDVDSTSGLEDYVEYHRYIKEVVKALESDPAFREKLEKANDADIRSGNIASELELVSHHIRTRLDEIKRTELHRLKELANRRDALMNNQLDNEDPLHHHIDHHNPHTFEIEDLKKLIVKTTEDLAEADKKRRDEFKEYELQKKYEELEKLNQTNGEEEKHKLEEEFKQMEDQHKKHPKLHTPGHKQHLEEVWEEQDHMTQDFNPKTFFMLHDLDSNGLWDQDEVKALFVKELDKMYAQGAPEDDMRERIEEMERMREAVFTEIDLNRDGFIDYKEFLQQTKKNNFDKDPGWKGLDEQKPYTNEELEEYVRRRHEQPYYQNMHNHGYPQGYPQAYPQGYPYQGYPQGHAQQGYPQAHPQAQMHPPQGYQQGYQQGHPQQGYQQGSPHQGYQQGQFHPGQLPQAQVNPQQINQMQGNYHGNDLNTNEVYPNSHHYAAGQGNHHQKQPPQQQQQQKPINPAQYQSNSPEQQQQGQKPPQQPQQPQEKQNPQPPSQQRLQKAPVRNSQQNKQPIEPKEQLEQKQVPSKEQIGSNAVPKQGVPAVHPVDV